MLIKKGWYTVENFNYILNDESNNDKLLVKEMSIYIKHHKNKKLPINRNFVKDIINIVLENSEIDYNMVKFIDEKDEIAYWDNYNKSLFFNITEILKEAKRTKSEILNSNIGDNNIFMYYDILVTIIHELTHARQEYVRNIEKNNIYNTGYALIDKNYDEYVEHHDEILVERYANLRGHLLAYQVLTYVYPYKQIKDFRNLICGYLLYGYKVNTNGNIVFAGEEYTLYNDCEIISAIDGYNEIMEKNLLPKVTIDLINDMSLYDRLYLGLSISTYEYHELRFLCEDMASGIKNDNDVKKLVNEI